MKTSIVDRPKKETANTKYFVVGIDMHKKFMQVAVTDSKGRAHYNEKIECNNSVIRKAVSKMPDGTKYVLESSSVWYGMCRFLTGELVFYIMPSNPLATKQIAESKKKTDKADAEILADLLRCGYISGCQTLC